MVQPLWRIVCRFLKKLKIELPYDPAIPLLSIRHLNIAALFTIVRTWKQPKCPSIEEWIKKMYRWLTNT